MTFGNFALDFGVRGRRGNGGGASSVTFVGAAQAGWASGGGYTFDLTALTGGSDTSPSDGDLVLWCGANGKNIGTNPITLPANMELLGLVEEANGSGNVHLQLAYLEASSTTELVFPGDDEGGVSSVVLVFRGVEMLDPLFLNSINSATDSTSIDPPAVTHTPAVPGVSIYAAAACILTNNTQSITDPGSVDAFFSELETSPQFKSPIGVGFNIGQSAELTVDFGNAGALTLPSVSLALTLAADQGLTENALTITNAGAESGDLTGWTDVVAGMRVGSGTFDGGKVPPEGTYAFRGPLSSAGAQMYQDIDVSAHATAIDAGKAYAIATWQQASYNGADTGLIWMEFLDGSDSELGEHDRDAPEVSPNAWAAQTTGIGAIPTGTRTIRLQVKTTRGGGSHTHTYIDEIAATLWVQS